jgi:peptidoglycan/xylan/chitin deacetylase (PgdA/CDA1 family)
MSARGERSAAASVKRSRIHSPAAKTALRWSLVKLYLTFDVEIWCDGWLDIESRFPSCFARYVYGRSGAGSYALPKTLEILDRHGFKGVFFVEPLFAARFGVDHLAIVVDLIASGGHDIQLHLHPEWSDEIRPPLFPAAGKRQHLSHYTLEEQVALLDLGRSLLAEAGSDDISAFRAGSFACNHDTYRALRQVGIGIDSSLHAVLPHSGVDLRDNLDFLHPLEFEQVTILPMTVFQDGIGRLRPAQVGACSFGELRDALQSAADNDTQHFVVLSHNFEMLRQGRSDPDRVVVSRFERLCEFLGGQRGRIEVSTLSRHPIVVGGAPHPPVARAGLGATLQRHGEQAYRRLFG